MRVYFSNIKRPKKASKHVANLVDRPLAQVQWGVARACGYLDWHELEQCVGASPPSPLDQDLKPDEFTTRHVRLSLWLSQALHIPDGDGQYALANARLTGDRTVNISDQLAIRLACFDATNFSWALPRSPGALGTLKTPGRNGEVVFLRRRGRPTEVVSDRGVTTVADFEYVTPRTPPSPFLPMRLYLPYGAWTEQDGAQVVFSRDYNPLWRIHGNGKVDRLEPWRRIRFEKTTHFWDDAKVPWRDTSLRVDIEERLAAMGIKGMPILADTLPLLVNPPDERSASMSGAVELLRTMRSLSLSAATA